jgi:hypothetical protein
MKTCPKCGKLYADKFASCPHCSGRTQAIGCLAFAVICVVAFVIWSAVGSGDHTTSAPSCTNDWSKCTDNAELANHYSGWTKVQAYCKVEAANEARYGTPVWPWIPFGSYLPGNDYVTTGIAVAIEQDAQFQNGFGAMAHSTVTCKYDLRADKVLSVEVEPH